MTELIELGKGEWISVKKRDPEDGEECEVRTKSGAVYRAIHCCDPAGKPFGWMMDVTRNWTRSPGAPTHWRRLANPKTGEGVEG